MQRSHERCVLGDLIELLGVDAKRLEERDGLEVGHGCERYTANERTMRLLRGHEAKETADDGGSVLEGASSSVSGVRKGGWALVVMDGRGGALGLDLWRGTERARPGVPVVPVVSAAAAGLIKPEEQGVRGSEVGTLAGSSG